MDNILPKNNRERIKHEVLLSISILMIIWSYINAIDYFAWFMLTLPAVIIIISLVMTYKKFQFTTFTYVMVCLHIIVLLIGAKYRYVGNPLFIYFKETFDLSRNYFDRVGHFMQGFAPMLMTKEFTLRKGYMKKSKYFNLIIMGFILGISATWELLEFFATLITKKPSSYILSSQDVLWDTQWDMVLAIIGGFVALFIFGKLHDKYIAKMKNDDLIK